MRREPTRGGRKLLAGIEHFGLAASLRDVFAVDVGASTGGFVTALLTYGARHVTAVDVGHGQLLPDLAADPRVTNAERTDFKTLTLHQLPGPFDFFSVDVSFVAARSMLRPLAFRLRDGAHGIVLLKPQFELPSHHVIAGNVSHPELRRQALKRFLDKAKRLGFSMLDQMDSPIEGGSGTVEILLHLRFEGRPAILPKKGEQRPHRPIQKKTKSLPIKLRWFAVAAPGLEAVLGEELHQIEGCEQVAVIPGGVEFQGSLAAGMRANLHSRIATRILLRLGEVNARDFAPMRRRLAKLPWAQFIPTDRPLRVDASTHRCRLYHTGALAETIALAVNDAVGDLPKQTESPLEEERPQTRIVLRGEQDRFMVSLDSSGELLHKRGWRTETGSAPLRETLAAALLRLCHYDPHQPFVDPMCGSGTFSIEAASMARNLAPGSQRNFAFTAWPCHDKLAWNTIRAVPSNTTIEPIGPILTSDRDPHAVKTAQRNAERAGLLSFLTLTCAPLEQIVVPSGPGLVVLNPPYGHRLGDRRDLSQMFRKLGQRLRQTFPNYRAAILCPDRLALDAITAGCEWRPEEIHPLRNGGLQIFLAIWSFPPQRK